jgi:hypothetical protein
MDAIKVTDPTKMVTDPVLLAYLEKQGIDKDYVELTSDYAMAVKGKSSPYAKFYRDLKSDKQFIVISQLPMVDHQGQIVEVGWQKTDKGYTEKNNLFKADVSGLQVGITVRNDQPDGRKGGQQVAYYARLFLGGEEQKPVSEDAALLSVDSLNENYADNTLEWDYGICKRRLRVIEGRLLGSWVFSENPGGEVRIRYNQSGDFTIKLGQFKVNDDEEYIAADYFEKPVFGYPLTISDSATFYPDANPETSSVDGYVNQSDYNGTTWASIHDGAGNEVNDSIDDWAIAEIYADDESNKWRMIRKAIFLFDTSSLDDNAIISAATLSLYGGSAYPKADPAGWLPTINIYSSNPASNTALVGSDYATLGTTAFCNTPITYAAWSQAYNDFALNTTGIAAISKTGVSKFGAREAKYDVANSAPTWSNAALSYFGVFFAEKGTGYKPKLVVTYTLPQAKTSSDSGNGAEAVSLRELGTVETGSGAEANLAAAAMLASDGGNGSETGGLLKSLFGSDAGDGMDGVKILTGKAGYDLRLKTHGGQVSITHKEVNL